MFGQVNGVLILTVIMCAKRYFICSPLRVKIVPCAMIAFAALNLQLYTLTPTSGGSATQVDVEINVDPLGNFPVFFVNL